MNIRTKMAFDLEILQSRKRNANADRQFARQLIGEMVNPKRANKEDRDDPFSFYAGYSLSFASKTVAAIAKSGAKTILDPWNGHGTTSVAAAAHGLQTVGIELNPIMLIRSIARMEYLGFLPVQIIQVDRQESQIHRDPLRKWTSKHMAGAIRGISQQILANLPKGVALYNAPERIRDTPGLALALFALFRTVRATVKADTKNPTWTRRKKKRTSTANVDVFDLFDAEYKRLLKSASERERQGLHFEGRILSGSALDLKFSGETLDAVLTSPPYCTRIDYAVLTELELSIVDLQGHFRELREKLTGTTAIRKNVAPGHDFTGNCGELLETIRTHTSKASESYYLKFFRQYFLDLRASIESISKVLRPGSAAIFVVQDSYYKDVHIDLANVVKEFCELHGFHMIERADFDCGASMVQVNTRARVYKKNRTNQESIVCAIKKRTDA